MPDSSLLLLLNEVRGKTLRLLDGVSEKEARRSPRWLQNHIVWHAGHCYVLVESLAMEAIGQQPQIPNGWFEMFSWKSNPGQVAPDQWPTLVQVVSHLADQHRRLRQAIEPLTEGQLSSMAPGDSGRPVRYAIVHGLHDEACHSGEIWLLRKMMRSSESGSH